MVVANPWGDRTGGLPISAAATGSVRCQVKGRSQNRSLEGTAPSQRGRSPFPGSGRPLFARSPIAWAAALRSETLPNGASPHFAKGHTRRPNDDAHQRDRAHHPPCRGTPAVDGETRETLSEERQDAAHPNRTTNGNGFTRSGLGDGVFGGLTGLDR